MKTKWGLISAGYRPVNLPTRSDHRFAALPDAAARDEDFGVALRRHLLDIGTGGKGALAAGQNDRADRGVALEIVQCRTECGDLPRVSAFSTCGWLSATIPTEPRRSMRMLW